MEQVTLELCVSVFLISGQIIFLPGASLLYYAHIYQADFQEMNTFLNQSKFLKFLFKKDRKTFRILGFTTKGSLDKYHNRQRIQIATIAYIFSVILIFAVVVICIQGIEKHFGTSTVAFYVGIFIVQLALAIRILLIGRGLKSFVKHKSNTLKN